MAITMNDLKDTYIKLVKDVNVYYTPKGGDNGSPVWFTKKSGQIAGKVFMWIEPNAPGDFGRIQNAYLIFKINDDFYNPNAPWYFIKYDTGMIDWEFSRKQLAAKQTADMSLWERFVSQMETNLTEVQGYVQNALVVGGVFLLAIAYWQIIGKYQVQAKVYSGVLKTTVKELKG